MPDGLLGLANPSARQELDAQLSLILPAYNEADNLRILLPQIKQVICDLGIATQILVVAAASPGDDTQQVCEENQVTCIRRRGGESYGWAIRTGVKDSVGEFIIIMDSDGSHNPDFIRELWGKRDHADIVIASRYIPGGATDNPWVLVGLSKVLNLVFKVFVGLPVYDVSNSFRLYRGKLLRELELSSLNFDVLEEILAKLIWGSHSETIRVLELPFHFEKRKYGKPKRKLIVFGIHFLRAIIRLRQLKLTYFVSGK